ncbi:MAG: hypothetical protein ACRC35_12485, partial [Angustibacter sp.]
AVRAQQRIENELRSRYGLSFSPLSGLADDVTRADAAQQRHRAVAERAEAQRLMAGADAAERAAEATAAAGDQVPALAAGIGASGGAQRAAEAAYDSAERREAAAEQLEAEGVPPDTVAAWTRSDVNQAKPATEATRGGAGRRAPKAWRRAAGRGTQRQVSGPSR